MPRHNLADCGCRETDIADIAEMLRSVTPGVANGCERFLHPGLIAINQRDERAFSGKQHGAGAADAGTGSRDNSDPSL